MFFLVDKEILVSHKHVKQPVNIKVAHILLISRMEIVLAKLKCVLIPQEYKYKIFGASVLTTSGQSNFRLIILVNFPFS